MLIRPAALRDLDGIHRLALDAGIGITTLSKKRELLEQRIQLSIESFAKTVGVPAEENYLFVMEDTTCKKVVGTSAIEAYAGFNSAFYSFNIRHERRSCPSLHIQRNNEILILTKDNTGHSELCTLYLDPEYRRLNNGILLSRSRFLFMAAEPKRFSSIIIADMRGISDEKGVSPFWNRVSSHFIPMSFAEADQLTSTNKKFIEDLMPKDPLYVKLLDAEARAVIGKAHPASIPALQMLNQEGFQFKNYIDIFDAGPTLLVEKSKIKSIVASKTYKLTDIKTDILSTSAKPMLIAKQLPEFRACLSKIVIDTKSNSCAVDEETARLLDLQTEDSILTIPVIHQGTKD